MRLIVVLSLFAMLCSSELKAFSFPNQHALLNHSVLKDSNALYFNFSNANFLWNNEFFNDVVEGYTLIGYFITPQLQYHFSPNLRIDAGGHFLKYSGVNKFSSIVPTYSVTYSKNDFTLIMGTLQGTVHHKLAEPLFFSERYFTNTIENGVQYLLNKDRLWLDVWLDWQTFIFPGDTKQEELLFGVNALPQLIQLQNFRVEGIASLLAGHRGGQIDAADKNIKTALNYGLGLNISQQISLKFIDKLSLESQYIGFYDSSPTVESIYENGGGYLNNIRFSKNESYFQLGHWSANHYLSIMGHPIYQSYSSVDTLLHKENRNLVTANIFYSKSIFKGVYLGLMADVFYDLDAKITDYSMGLTLIVKQDFFLTRFNNRKTNQ